MPRAYAASRYAIVRRRQFARLIRHLADACGGVSALARELGVPRSRLNEWLREQRREISAEHVGRLLGRVSGEELRLLLREPRLPQPTRLPIEYRAQLAALLRQARCAIADDEAPERVLWQHGPGPFALAYDRLQAVGGRGLTWPFEVLAAFCWSPPRIRVKRRMSRRAAIAGLLALRSAPPLAAVERLAAQRESDQVMANFWRELAARDPRAWRDILDVVSPNEKGALGDLRAQAVYQVESRRRRPRP